MKKFLGEVHSIETADGEITIFDYQETAIPVYGGYGAPSIEYITRKGYKQHGETVEDYQLTPRAVNLEIWVKGKRYRQEMWDAREALIEMSRPNRGGPMKLVIQQPDGSRRALSVNYETGLEFGPNPGDNNWGVNVPVTLIAHDPIWYNPDAKVITMFDSGGGELVFPATFPISFGYGNGYSTGVLNYAGSWDAPFTIELTGPYKWARIINTATDVFIDMATPLAAGQKRTIYLAPGHQTIQDADGVSRFNELGPLSDLINLNIRPENDLMDPQEIIVKMLSRTAASGAVLTYHERYYAL